LKIEYPPHYAGVFCLAGFETGLEIPVDWFLYSHLLACSYQVVRVPIHIKTLSSELDFLEYTYIYELVEVSGSSQTRYPDISHDKVYFGIGMLEYVVQDISAVDFREFFTKGMFGGEHDISYIFDHLNSTFGCLLDSLEHK
jgi:hypothetical protein